MSDNARYSPASGGRCAQHRGRSRSGRLASASAPPTLAELLLWQGEGSVLCLNNCTTHRRFKTPTGRASPFLPQPSSTTCRLQQPCCALQPCVTRIWLKGIILLQLKSTAKFSLTPVLLDYALKENHRNEMKQTNKNIKTILPRVSEFNPPSCFNLNFRILRH